MDKLGCTKGCDVGKINISINTGDFAPKTFSTSFGSFAQFLVVISHNNYKWETSKGILVDTDKTFHLHVSLLM